MASNYLEQLFRDQSVVVQQKASQEFIAFQAYCAASVPWTPHKDAQALLRFPLVSKIRTRLTNSPAVSSSSERGFSTTRRIETKDRNRLSEQTTEMLTFINLNMRSKTPKSPLVWQDFEKAILADDRSSLDIIIPSVEAAQETPANFSSSDETVNLFQDFQTEARSPIVRVLTGSPESEDVDFSSVVSSDSLDFVSPLIETSLSTISYSFIDDVNEKSFYSI